MASESLEQETNSTYTGGEHASYLLLPVVPAMQGQTTASRATVP